MPSLRENLLLSVVELCVFGVILGLNVNNQGQLSGTVLSLDHLNVQTTDVLVALKTLQNQQEILNQRLNSFRSCEEIRSIYPYSSNGNYDILIEDTVFNLYCDFDQNPARMLVGSFFEVIEEDDFPNTQRELAAGWVKLSSGVWNSSCTHLTPVMTGALSLESVAALERSRVIGNIAILLIGSNNETIDFRDSTTVSKLLTMVTYKSTLTPPSFLDPYTNFPVAYTFGRLAGLFGSSGSFDNYPVKNTIETPIVAGEYGEFGDSGVILEYDSNDHRQAASWHAYGGGAVFSPQRQSAKTFETAEFWSFFEIADVRQFKLFVY